LLVCNLHATALIRGYRFGRQFALQTLVAALVEPEQVEAQLRILQAL
jgi:hypothetical protein